VGLRNGGGTRRTEDPKSNAGKGDFETPVADAVLGVRGAIEMTAEVSEDIDDL
jgi:hypothetical protein